MADLGNSGRSTKRTRLVQELKEKANSFIQDRKKSNNIVDILAHLESEDAEELLPAMRAVQKVFLHSLELEMMHMARRKVPFRLAVEDKYRSWLFNRYEETKVALFKLLSFNDKSVQDLALIVLMKFLAKEGYKPTHPKTRRAHYFPPKFFRKVVSHLLRETVNTRLLILRFKEFSAYDDIRHHLLKILLFEIQSRRRQQPGEIFLSNCFGLLEGITLSSPTNRAGGGRQTAQQNLLCRRHGTRVHYVARFGVDEAKKMFSPAWTGFLRFKLPIALYKKLLVILHDKVLPYLEEPLLLTDFLIESYNFGGVISLLALNSLYVLLQKYNLEYPEFYKKLYSLFKPEVFHVKYTARFFYLSDLFLSSTHLPEYLVAAFAKKLSRLSLFAPPHTLLLLLPFVHNLLIRHRNLDKLTHDPSGPTDLESDPFLMDEPDPAKCLATLSSLWEIKTLQCHYSPEVQIAAQFVNRSLPHAENDLSQLYEKNMNEIFQKEAQRQFQDVPLSTWKATGLFGHPEDKLHNFWSME